MRNIDQYYVVEMPDGSKWKVPVAAIAMNYAKYYAEVDDTTIEKCLLNAAAIFENKYEINDWASGNMNWSEVMDKAVCIQPPTRETDYDDGWMNGDWEISSDV